ncbi:hypothetical protein EVAR_51824_1 [Eumeta japonica]|uniref:Uncharacterized protein n=1 Tax=Eumeta variegata TaxID=151549 RepID=A0A4C1XUV9_EUMVA|nr:hypothetical protein EVAR_51824_1 [Eumeta japonica]
MLMLHLNTLGPVNETRESEHKQGGVGGRVVRGFTFKPEGSNPDHEMADDFYLNQINNNLPRAMFKGKRGSPSESRRSSPSMETCNFISALSASREGIEYLMEGIGLMERDRGEWATEHSHSLDEMQQQRK